MEKAQHMEAASVMQSFATLIDSTVASASIPESLTLFTCQSLTQNFRQADRRIPNCQDHCETGTNGNRLSIQKMLPP